MTRSTAADGPFASHAAVLPFANELIALSTTASDTTMTPMTRGMTRRWSFWKGQAAPTRLGARAGARP